MKKSKPSNYKQNKNALQRQQEGAIVSHLNLITMSKCSENIGLRYITDEELAFYQYQEARYADQSAKHPDNQFLRQSHRDYKRILKTRQITGFVNQ